MNCPVLRIAAVMKAHRLGQLLDLRLLAGQEVPAIAVGLVLQMLVHAVDVNLLLLGRVLRCLVRIEAHRDNFVFIARRKLQHAQRAGFARQFLAAQHGAGVIHQVQDDRPAGVEVIAQLHRLAGLVLELQIERQLLIRVADRCPRSTGPPD